MNERGPMRRLSDFKLALELTGSFGDVEIVLPGPDEWFRLATALEKDSGCHFLDIDGVDNGAFKCLGIQFSYPKAEDHGHPYLQAYNKAMAV